MTSRSSFAFALFLGILLLFSGANADHHHKNNKDSDALTQCTIQSSDGGGGCVSGLKRVCQKLKNGNECCGCVPDKNDQASQPGKVTPESDQGSKDAKTTTTPDTTNTNQNVLWGDYTSLPKH